MHTQLHDFIEIYIKLVIAIVSFIAPLIVALLSVFSDGVGVMREKINAKTQGIARLLHDQTKGGGHFDNDQVNKSTKALTEAQGENQTIGNLLNPKRQIKRVFIPLIGSLFFIMLSKLNEASLVITYRDWVYIVLLSLSFVCTVLSILVLKQIAWKVIETKDEISRREKQKTAPSITPVKNIEEK